MKQIKNGNLFFAAKKKNNLKMKKNEKIKKYLQEKGKIL
jgi:hypothetical protein